MPNPFDRSKKDQPGGDQIRVTIREDQGAPNTSNPELRPASSYGTDPRGPTQAMTPYQQPQPPTPMDSGGQVTDRTTGANPVVRAVKSITGSNAGQNFLAALMGQVPVVLNILASSLGGLTDTQRLDLKKRLEDELDILSSWCDQAEASIRPNGRQMPNADRVKSSMTQLERVTLELISMYNRYANQVGRTDPRLPAIATSQLGAQDSGKMRKFSNEELQKLVYDMGRHAQSAGSELKRVRGTLSTPTGDNPMSLAWVIDQLLILAQNFGQTQSQLRQEMYKEKKDGWGPFRG